jgi:hypothetical protein
MPEDLKVGKKTGKKSTAGRDVYLTPKGKEVSELSITIPIGDNWINVPSIHNGIEYSENDIVDMLKAGKIKVTSIHKTKEEALEAADKRSKELKEGGQPMAKKKSDTKGLAGIVKNVPRELDIKGQKHMLAWITPKEGETLKALGGAGILGPMGIPAFPPTGAMGKGGVGSATSGGGNKGGFSGPEDRGELGGGTDKGSSVSGGGGSKGGDGSGFSYDADTGIDAETDDPDTAGAGSKESPGYDPATGLGTRTGKYGQDPANKAAIDAYAAAMRSKGYSGYNDTSYALGLEGQNRKVSGITREQYANMPGWMKTIYDKLGTPTAREVYNYDIDPKTGKVKGFYHDSLLPDSPLISILKSIFGKKPEEMTEEDLWGVYTGYARQSPFDDGKGRDEEKKFGITPTVSATDPITGVSVSPADYYSKGVGSATIDLYDPTKIDAYLAQLYGVTPSPIGAKYDAATSSYTMPGSSRKRRTRLRGLDIFKPVSM